MLETQNANSSFTKLLITRRAVPIFDKSINCISLDTTCSGDVGMKEEGRSTESGAALTFLQLGSVQWESWLLWIEHGSVEHVTGN